MNPYVNPEPAVDPGRRLAEALHAQAVSSAAAPGVHPAAPAARRSPQPRPDAALRRQIVWALVIALLAGLVLGAGIGLVSLLFPGVLPTVG
ncbi:hypothetical protein LWC35_30900 [Pseudonocardia kujensis]|uniref:hypothetical protein n=1 Tax=Pseudonocardia kujensis TaxID=1128675 RepID=UPI001E2A2BF3|nr:hypothetical protein [Pseudonocardia kujensis]MCE0767280.1 hypothetical protein [Pseudonocardia kujensis]